MICFVNKKIEGNRRVQTQQFFWLSRIRESYFSGIMNTSNKQKISVINKKPNIFYLFDLSKPFWYFRTTCIHDTTKIYDEFQIIPDCGFRFVYSSVQINDFIIIFQRENKTFANWNEFKYRKRFENSLQTNNGYTYQRHVIH